MKENVDKDIDMANAKSLIIIKPMSAQLQKLYEVLASVAAEENIEIIATDNLGELAQLYSMGGQHLTLVSDPKICVIFLQENRTYNLAKHSKTLLFTPKTLPPKILDKFVKLGLTENLLDTAAPKTLLYKVKLLLKSIKSNDKLENKSDKQEQVVKSMLDLNQEITNEKAAIHHTNEQRHEEGKGSLAEELKKKKIELELEAGLDYLKKKKVYQEDSIQTNWSSKKNTSSEELTFDEANPGDIKKKMNNGNEDLDGYFRSKETKQVNLDLVASKEEIKTKKTPYDETDETEKKEKKHQVEIVLTEAREKSAKPVILAEEETYPKVKSLAGTEIEIELGKNESKDSQEQIAEEDVSSRAKKAQLELDIESSKKEKLKIADTEDAPGRMSGKLKSLNETEIDLGESGLKAKEKKEYDKATEEEKLKKLAFELELEKSKHEKKEACAVNEEESQGRKRKKSNGIEIDLSDALPTNNNDQTDDELNTPEKKKKSTNTEIEFSKENKERNDNETPSETDTSDKIRRTRNIELEMEESESKKNEKLINEEHSGKFNKRNITKTDGAVSSSEDKKDKSATDETEIEKNRRAASNELELINANEKDDKIKALNQEKEENQKARSKGITELDIDPSKKRLDGNTVEKIDSYMRGGEAKNDDQDWSQKKQGKDVTLKMSSTSQREIDIKRDARRDMGEVVIDYRMLKEEFNELGRSGYKSDTALEKTNSKIHGDENEEGSFKVVELKANGFDFAISIINQYYNQDIKAPVIYKSIAQKLLTEEKAYCVFYTFLNISNEHKESFSSFKEFQPAPTEYWEEFKKEDTNLTFLYSKTMSTWLCREIKEKDSFWSDNELPAWAPQELTNKVVEYVYPFYDGLDRMGMAYLYFPEGIRPQSEKKILVLLELLRGVFLETIQRNSASTEDVAAEIPEAKKGNVLSMFGNLFGKKKTG